MYHSAEIRWYFEGEATNDVRSWFKRDGLGTDEPERIDEYLLLPGCETTGVKLRDGRFEVKALTAWPAPVSYPNGVSGLRDAWVKWSSKTFDTASFRKLVRNADDRWIFVKKSRALRTFSLEASTPEEVDATTPDLRRGCQIELTSIRALAGKQDDRAINPEDWQRSGPWWSLSFEAFGEPPALIDYLDRMATHFFQEPTPIHLTTDSSFSYPVWLARNV